MIEKTYTAADFEQAFGGFVSEGNFDLARRALKEAKRLRESGDISTEPTQPTLADYEELATKLEASARALEATAEQHRFNATVCRLMALDLEEKG